MKKPEPWATGRMRPGLLARGCRSLPFGPCRNCLKNWFSGLSGGSWSRPGISKPLSAAGDILAETRTLTTAGETFCHQIGETGNLRRLNTDRIGHDGAGAGGDSAHADGAGNCYGGDRGKQALARSCRYLDRFRHLFVSSFLNVNRVGCASGTTARTHRPRRITRPFPAYESLVMLLREHFRPTSTHARRSQACGAPGICLRSRRSCRRFRVAIPRRC